MKFLPLEGAPSGPVLPPRALSFSAQQQIFPAAPDLMRTLCPCRGPGGASALLYPGCDPVSLRYCPHPPLLPTQGKAGAGWAEGWKERWEAGGHMASRNGEKGIGSSPMKSGGGLGQRTSPLLMTFLSSSCRCERQLRPVRYELSLRGASAAAQARSPSGALALGSVVCGGGCMGLRCRSV